MNKYELKHQNMLCPACESLGKYVIYPPHQDLEPTRTCGVHLNAYLQAYHSKITELEFGVRRVSRVFAIMLLD